MWILDVILVLLIIAAGIVIRWGYLEWKDDPDGFFEPENAKKPLDVPIYTKEKPSFLDKILEWIE